MKLNKQIAALLLCASVITNVSAQLKNEEIILKAMNDELQRTKNELFIEGQPRPYMIVYTYSRAMNAKVTAKLGGIVNSENNPTNALGGIQMYFGDYKVNSDVMFNNQIPSVRMPQEVDYNWIRDAYWAGSDVMYKQTILNYKAKLQYLKDKPQTNKFEYDMTPLKKVETYMVPTSQYDQYNHLEWEKKIADLSTVLGEYAILNTSVTGSVMHREILKITTEGTKLRMPQSMIKIEAVAALRTNDGQVINDNYTKIVPSEDFLPSQDDLKKELRKFAQSLIDRASYAGLEEMYTGPVLFMESASFRCFHQNFLLPGELIAERTALGGRQTLSFSKKIGKKILNSNISVYNITNMREYKGKKVYGYCEIDGEGIRPAAQLTLVENGILKSFINGRVPAVNAPESTGSSLFKVSDNTTNLEVSPATVHFSVKKGDKIAKLKKELIKMAKDRGLDFAVIVRSFAGSNEDCVIYKVNLENGEETPLMSSGIREFASGKFTHLLGVSSEDMTVNYFWRTASFSTMICPKAILIDDIEVIPYTKNVFKKPVFSHPFLND